MLSNLGYSLLDFSREAVDRLALIITEAASTSSRVLETERKEIEGLRQTVAATLSLAWPGDGEPNAKLSQLKERLAATEGLRAKLGHFSSSFPWPAGRPLAELAVEAELIRKVAADLQVALGREKQARTTYADSINRKAHLQKQLADLQPRMNRLKAAQTTLHSLISKHSLKRAMDSALQANRAGMEAIFKSIHSPADFRGLGTSWTTLVRKVDGSEANLGEISTGQRAAFALSIFLAQNAQLTKAPPVLLIDDPIAHVDDLNSLSFLDYLREIVLRGKRQIFFTTANEKLASLFERKFDFLGSEGFRRFNLKREASPVKSDK